MITSNPVVDINVDPLGQARRRRRALLRIGIPLGGVALMIATILFIAFYSLSVVALTADRTQLWAADRAHDNQDQSLRASDGIP